MLFRNGLFAPSTTGLARKNTVRTAFVRTSTSKFTVVGSSLARNSLLLSFLNLSACSQPPIAVSDQRYGASDSVDGGDASKGEDNCLSLADAVIGYEITIKNIIEKQCLGGCHEAGLQTPPLSTYAEVKAAASVSLDSIVAGRMPRRRNMTADEKKLFANWVSAGMPQSDAAATDAATTTTSDSKVTNAVGQNSPTDKIVAPTKSTKKTLPKCTKPKVSGPPSDPGNGVKNYPVAATPVAQVTYTTTIEPYLRAKCFGCHGPARTPPVISDYETAKASAGASLATILDKSMPKGGSNTPTEAKNFEAWVQGGSPK